MPGRLCRTGFFTQLRLWRGQRPGHWQAVLPVIYWAQNETERMNSKMTIDLGKKIKSLRHSAGLTQEQLAQKLSVTPQAVSKWESGDSLR